MKNRILGISVLAAAVLGLAFVSCGPAADTEVTFINLTAVKVTIVSDGSPNPLTLNKLSSLTGDPPEGTVTKTGGDLTITSLKFEGIEPDDWDEFLNIEISTMPTQKKPPKDTLTLGSGVVTFDWVKKNDNPAGVGLSKISVIPLDE